MWGTNVKRRLRPALLAGVALLVMLAALPARLALAAPAGQDEATPLLLGEFGSAAMSAGDRADFVITLPFDGTYLVIFTGDGDPAALALLVVDGEGNEAYNGAMEGELPLELAAGPYQLSFEAQSDVDLSFVVGTESGSMTADIFEPGELINGVSYYEENVDAERYAVLTIEPSSYPQKAVILLQGDEGDVYEVEVYSEDGGYYWTSTDESDIVSFPTTGGDYDVTVRPLEGGASLRVTVFLSGPAPLLNPDEPMDGEVTDGEDVDTYQFTVNNAGAVVTVQAESGNGNSVDLAAGLLPDDDTWSTYSFGEPATLEFIAPLAGTYFINIATDNTDGDTYTIVASEGDVVPSLPINDPVAGKVAEGAATGYLLEVTEPDQFVVVVLAGPDEEDLDLSIERFEADGSRGLSDSTYTAGSKEIVGVFSAEPGTFIVTIDASYASETDFVVLATLGSLEELLSMPEEAAAVEEAPQEEATPAPETGKKGETEVVPPEVATPAPEEEALIEQWAVAAVASSQYTDDAWSAQQMVGEPDTPEAGDFETAWAAAYADTQLETVTLTFATAVVPTAVEIYESYNPGAVALIEVLDLNTDGWVVVWEGTAGPTGEEMAVFSPPLDAAGLVTDQVRITLDEPAVEGWNEIDAVKLIGVAE